MPITTPPEGRGRERQRPSRATVDPASPGPQEEWPEGESLRFVRGLGMALALAVAFWVLAGLAAWWWLAR